MSDREVAGVLATNWQATEGSQQNGRSELFVEMPEETNSSPVHDPAFCRTGSRTGCSSFFHALPGAILTAAKFISLSRADLAMRGLAISFLTLARVASSNSFLTFFFIVLPC
jgi:hypothetical protein